MKDKNRNIWIVALDSITFRFNSKESAFAFVDFVKEAWEGYLDGRHDNLEVCVFGTEQRGG